MGISNWLSQLFSSRGKALSLYRRGMVRAKQQDHDGAIVNYSAAIDLPNSPADVRAMALFNRALVYSSDKEISKAIADLNAVLMMPESPPDIKTEARRKLERMRRQSSKASE